MFKALSVVAALRNFIKIEAIKATGIYKNPCVKQEVFACLIQADGTMSFGTNAMATAISLCPRVQLGISGYEPCADMCHQGPEFHAERQAIWNAYYENDNLDLTGAVMFITGHVVCCDTCCQAMFDEGIVYAGSLDSGRYYERGETTMKETLPTPPEEISFDDVVYAWHKTPKYREFIAYNNGQTSIIDLWHKDGVVYRTHRQREFRYNIYNEPSYIDVLIDEAVGFVYERDDRSYCAYYGAYTEINWLPYIVPELPEFEVTDLDSLEF